MTVTSICDSQSSNTIQLQGSFGLSIYYTNTLQLFCITFVISFSQMLLVVLVVIWSDQWW